MNCMPRFLVKSIAMHQFGSIGLGLLLMALVLDGDAARAEFVEKRGKVLEWGWDTPPPTTVRSNIEAMQQVPFDGLILDLRKDPPHANDTSDYLSWKVWSTGSTQNE